MYMLAQRVMCVHRWSASLRSACDLGYRPIKVTMPAESLVNAQRFGYVRRGTKKLHEPAD